jgi:hypothetical protein
MEGTMDKNRDMQFTNFLREKAKEAERKIRYRPSYFLAMLETEGGYRTALKLLSSNDVSDGFVKLWEHGRLDLSVEALVVESEWRQVFDPALLALAEKKLKKAKYAFARWDGMATYKDATTLVMDNAVEAESTAGKNRIVIDWPGGHEYIDIDLDKIGEDTDIYFTKQTYEDGKKLDIYEVSSAVRALDHGRYEIKISYDSTKNPDITDSWWGTTRIVMRKGDLTGVASWVDKHHKGHNGNFDFWTVYALEGEDSQRWRADDRALRERPDLEETVKQALRNERRGQQVFRERVLQHEPACRLTGVSDPAHLRASHIKPWAQSDSRERLDGSNGLMLSPHVDHLFDRAYISFNDDGTLLVLNDDINQLLQRWGIDCRKNPTTPTPFNTRQCAYLVHHRQHFASLRQQALATSVARLSYPSRSALGRKRTLQ